MYSIKLFEKVTYDLVFLYLLKENIQKKKLMCPIASYHKDGNYFFPVLENWVFALKVGNHVLKSKKYNNIKQIYVSISICQNRSRIPIGHMP